MSEGYAGYSTELNSEGQVEATGRLDSFGTSMPFTDEQVQSFETDLASQRAPDHEYGETDYEQFDPTDLIDAAIDSQFREYAPSIGLAYEPYEEATGDQIIAEATADQATTEADQRAYQELVARRPEIEHPDVAEEILPVLEALADEYGLAAASRPEVIERVYEAAGGDARWKQRVAEDAIKDGIVTAAYGRNPYAPDAFS